MPTSPEYPLGIDGPAYAILRIAKHSNFTSIRKSAQHNFREIDTANADPARTPLNKTFGPNTSAALVEAFRERLPVKRRKDAVLCIEYLITASPEWFEKTDTKTQNEYFKRAVQWLYDRHGKERVMCINTQVDELKPHLVSWVLPITPDNRLSARDYVGTRQILRDMQTDFAAKVGKPVGLQRGVERSRAIHQDTAAVSAGIKNNPDFEPPKMPAPSMGDFLTGKAKRMDEEYRAKMAEFMQRLDYAIGQARLFRKTRRDQAAAIKRLRAEAEDLRWAKETAERLQQERAELVARMEQREVEHQRTAERLEAVEEENGTLRKSLQFLQDRIARMWENVKAAKPVKDL